METQSGRVPSGPSSFCGAGYPGSLWLSVLTSEICGKSAGLAHGRTAPMTKTILYQMIDDRSIFKTFRNTWASLMARPSSRARACRLPGKPIGCSLHGRGDGAMGARPGRIWPRSLISRANCDCDAKKTKGPQLLPGPSDLRSACAETLSLTPSTKSLQLAVHRDGCRRLPAHSPQSDECASRVPGRLPTSSSVGSEGRPRDHTASLITALSRGVSVCAENLEVYAFRFQ